VGRGSAAAEEWVKGLEIRGKERMKASENWERWEVKYQWWSDHQGPTKPVSKAPSPVPVLTLQHQQPAPSPPRRAPSPIIYAPVPASKYRSVQFASKEGNPLSSFSNTHPVPTLTAAAHIPQHVQPRPSTVPAPVYTPQPVPGGAPPYRGERNLHDANEAKATRKADIERRCQLLNPPISPNILRHMDSFKAAIQISQPMTDYSWSVLQPRLLAQFPAAQQAEMDHVSRVTTSSTRTVDRRQQDASLKENKEVLDREWEESQRPIRDKLSAFADDFINQDWDHGRAVTYENSPKFAVDLLVHVRRKFYEDAMQAEPVPTEGSESDGPKLVLENMKWVYDNKLKPLTEQFRKELFLCYGNGCEGNTRFYGFEGVIQHFGAKHTNTFSVGNVVVSWRDAEWPEETPFHPDPISVKHAYHPASSTAGQGQSGYGPYCGGYSRAGTSTPHMQAYLPQASPNPYFGGQYNGPFAPPQATANPASGYEYAQSYGAPLDSYSSYQPMAPPVYGSNAANNGYMTSPAMTNVAIATVPALQPWTQGFNGHNGPAEASHRTNLFDKQVSTIIGMTQEIWKQTSGIKDLPNSLRVYVLLQRVISKFQVEFNHEPDLNHFIDAFSNHQIPKALKQAPGLSCKACQDEFSHQYSGAHASQREERRTYTVLSLFSHFQARHSGSQILEYGNGQLPTHLDWRENMIELPNDRFISGLIHAPGMDDEKLHMVATVFPTLFPTPLPRIGVVDNNGVPSPSHSASNHAKDATGPHGTPGISTEESGPPSFTDSPRPPKPTEDEYDPQRPALLSQANQSARVINRMHSYRGSPPPSDRRPQHYAEQRYYVGSFQGPNGQVFGANTTLSQLPREHLDDSYSGPREYIEYDPSLRRVREQGPVYEEHPGRRSIYREHEGFYTPGPHEVLYTHPRDGHTIQELGPRPQPVHYIEDEDVRPGYRLVRPRSRENSPERRMAEADRFLEGLVPSQPSSTKPVESTHALPPRPPATEPDLEDGSRYTPPPPTILPVHDLIDQHRSLGATQHTAPSTISNGSRYEEYATGGRQIPTPDPTVTQRRPGPIRRREKHNEHVPSRYYRYMSVAREEPYARGASIGRAQNRRYDRYEETRRRIDQQEIPQPKAERDYDAAYSRDQSVDQGPPDDHYYPPVARPAREYIPIQDRLHPSPSRIRYSGPSDEGRGPPPVYVDEFGQPMHEYEYVRVPRDHGPARPSSRYASEHDFQYVPVSYERPPLPRHEGRPGEYVYYEERERVLPARRPVYEAEEAAYEPPPDIKVEGGAPVAEGA
jgi:hypothetical protein